MFDRVPFACSGWHMGDRHLKTRGVCQLLQLDRPPPGPGSMTAATVGGHQQAWGVGIERPSHHVPPAADALDGKSGGVMIRSNMHPTRLVRLVVDTLWSHVATCLARQVMTTDVRRISRGAELAAMVSERPHTLRLLGVYRKHRLSRGLDCLALLVNVRELGSPVWGRATLKDLSVGLEAVVHGTEQLRDDPNTHVMSPAVQLASKPSHTLRGPAQGRVWGSPSDGLYQTFPITAKGLLRGGRALAPSSRFAHAASSALWWGGVLGCRQLLTTPRDGWPGDASGPRDQADASRAESQCLCSPIEPKPSFIQHRSNQFKSLPDLLVNVHAHTLT
jgi:hypothetical protein